MFTRKLEVISEHHRPAKEWPYRAYSSGWEPRLDLTWVPSLSKSMLSQTVCIVTQLRAVRCWSAEPAHLPTKIRCRSMGFAIKLFRGMTNLEIENLQANQKLSR